ncbi:MAG: hypothetical protein IBX68_11965, partial [Dehalococcoidia bacterium]|nr:hypothetical protein [Dehalococcoidia bacterium]
MYKELKDIEEYLDEDGVLLPEDLFEFEANEEDKALKQDPDISRSGSRFTGELHDSIFDTISEGASKPGNDLAPVMVEPTETEIWEEETEAEGLQQASLNLEEMIDDPVRMYLREMGRVPLLKAREEKQLARNLEEGRFVKRIEGDWHDLHQDYPTPVDLAISVLTMLGQAAPFIIALQEELGLPGCPGITQQISAPKLRSSIDGEIAKSFLEGVALRTSSESYETEKTLKELSLLLAIIPQQLLEVVDGDCCLSDLADMASKPQFRQKLELLEAALRAHWDCTRKAGERARRHLVEANLRLVVSIAK